jgi:hypothetical protein
METTQDFAVEQAARRYVEQLLVLSAKQDPSPSTGMCCRVVIEVLRGELDRLQDFWNYTTR